MIGIIFSDLSETEHLLINDSYCTFLQRMLSSALLDELKAHLTSDKHETTDEEIADLRRYIEDGINGLLLRTGRISSYLSSAQ
jgi:hypothetical protein